MAVSCLWQDFRTVLTHSCKLYITLYNGDKAILNLDLYLVFIRLISKYVIKYHFNKKIAGNIHFCKIPPNNKKKNIIEHTCGQNITKRLMHMHHCIMVNIGNKHLQQTSLNGL